MAGCKRIAVGLWVASRPKGTSTADTFTTGVSHHSGMNFVNSVLGGQGAGREGWGGDQRLRGERSPARYSEMMAPCNAEQALASKGQWCEWGAAGEQPLQPCASHLGGTWLRAGVPGTSAGA